MNIQKKIANKNLRTWAGSPRKGRDHTDGRNGVGDGKGGPRLARASKRGAQVPRRRASPAPTLADRSPPIAAGTDRYPFPRTGHDP